MPLLPTPLGVFTYPDTTESPNISVWTAHALTQVEQVIDRQRPSVRCAKTNSVGIISGGSGSAIFWNIEEWDPNDMHSPTTNANRLTAPLAGEYSVNAQLSFANDTSGVRQVSIRANGATIVAVNSASPVSGLPTRVNLAGSARLAVGGYVELLGFHTSSTSPLAVEVGSGATWMSMRWERGL